jgi:hypothetical protein
LEINTIYITAMYFLKTVAFEDPKIKSTEKID